MPEYISRVIADFDSLLDIDFGIIKLIERDLNAKDPETGEYFLNQSVIKADNYFLRCMLYSMESKDVPSIIKNETDDKEYAEYLYDSIKKDNKRYRQALELSPTTTILELFDVYMNTDGIVNVSVLCKTPLEEYIIRKVSPRIHIVMGNYKTDLSRYDVIYVNDYLDIIKYHENKKLEGKEIIIPDYHYNMDTKIATKPLIWVSLIMGASNKIKTLCPYKNFSLPANEED